MNYEVLANGSMRCPDDPGEPGYGELSRRISVTPHEANILSALALGRVVVEIGTGLGVSTRAMAKTAKLVQTLDVDPWVWENVWPELDTRILRAKQPQDLVGWVDMVFIDGLHTEAAVRRDLVLAIGCVGRADGLILLHDTNMAAVRTTVERSHSILDLTDNLGAVLL